MRKGPLHRRRRTSAANAAYVSFSGVPEVCAVDQQILLNPCCSRRRRLCCCNTFLPPVRRMDLPSDFQQGGFGCLQAAESFEQGMRQSKGAEVLGMTCTPPEARQPPTSNSAAVPPPARDKTQSDVVSGSSNRSRDRVSHGRADRRAVGPLGPGDPAPAAQPSHRGRLSSRPHKVTSQADPAKAGAVRLFRTAASAPRNTRTGRPPLWDGGRSKEA
jgi:hypothetical protein